MAKKAGKKQYRDIKLGDCVSFEALGRVVRIYRRMGPWGGDLCYLDVVFERGEIRAIPRSQFKPMTRKQVIQCHNTVLKEHGQKPRRKGR